VQTDPLSFSAAVRLRRERSTRRLRSALPRTRAAASAGNPIDKPPFKAAVSEVGGDGRLFA